MAPEVPSPLPKVSEFLRNMLEEWYPLEKRAVIEEPEQ